MSAKCTLMATSMSRIRSLTCAAGGAISSSTLRLAPQPPDIIKWVRREGGFVHQAVKVAYQADPTLGLGLVVTAEIPKGSELIVLPEHIPLRLGAFEPEGDNGSHSSLVKLAQYVPEELWAMKLGLKLLQERAKKGSFWWPYISNLPETYSVPIFFSGEDIKNLQYAPLLHQVNKRCRFLLDFERVVKSELENFTLNSHPFGGQDVDASSLGWAMSAVSSRAFRLHGKRQHDGRHVDIPMMLPLIDMCNHSFNPNSEIIQEQEKSDGRMLVKVVSRCQINGADPLELNYGNLSNDFFLLDYGFVVPSNPHDRIELKYDSALLDAASIAAGVMSADFSSPTPWQRHILSQLNLDGDASQAKVSIGGQELVEGRLLAALRACLSKDEEAVTNTDMNVLKSTSAEAPVGVATEVAALRTLIALCVIALEHFPTKIMEDEALLKQNVTASSELAIMFRIQKKFLLINAMRDLTRRVKLLSSKETSTAQS